MLPLCPLYPLTHAALAASTALHHMRLLLMVFRAHIACPPPQLCPLQIPNSNPTPHPPQPSLANSTAPQPAAQTHEDVGAQLEALLAHDAQPAARCGLRP